MDPLVSTQWLADHLDDPDLVVLDCTVYLRDLGVADGRRVVLYDANASMWAARVWWMLRWIGFDDAAVYTASMQEWAADPEAPLVTEPAP